MGVVIKVFLGLLIVHLTGVFWAYFLVENIDFCPRHQKSRHEKSVSLTKYHIDSKCNQNKMLKQYNSEYNNKGE